MVTPTGCGLSLIFTTMEPWSKTVWGCSKFSETNGETGFAGTDLMSFVKLQVNPYAVGMGSLSSFYYFFSISIIYF